MKTSKQTTKRTITSLKYFALGAASPMVLVGTIWYFMRMGGFSLEGHEVINTLGPWGSLVATVLLATFMITKFRATLKESKKPYNTQTEVISAESAIRILESHHGGVYKRIDENREMVELLQQQYPSLFEKQPWVEGWLKSQDGFLNDLANAVPPEEKLPRFNVIEGKFPRPWPVKKSTTPA